MAGAEKSNGYEAIASRFIAGRGRNPEGVGASVVAGWSRVLPRGASILDLGCGCGVPISKVLIDLGFKVHGVDASSTMVAAFREQFPDVPVECAAAEDSSFFDRMFDAVVSWGLFFLLSGDLQRKLITKVAAVLRQGGRFLFTSPSSVCCWRDAMTGQPSMSLGYCAYRTALQEAGMSLVGVCRDDGHNHYYDARKISGR